MIHQINSYIPDGKIYMAKSQLDNVVDNILKYSLVFFIDIEITTNQPKPRAYIKTNVMRMLR